ncbi:MAG: hypothetical protein V4727_05900 [Verrucomicrobiota bacterium]
MKTSYLSVVIGLLLPAVTFAEGGGNEDWAEKAAVGYEEKAAKAAADGNAADAAIYLKMAQIKRDAGAAAKAGKEFSWDEYHALSGQLGGGKKDKVEKEKNVEAKDKSHDKEPKEEKKEKGNPGDGFIGAAQEYQKLSIEAAKAGDADKAGIFAELAKMKLEAAAAANQGKDYDWAKYHELKGKLDK